MIILISGESGSGKSSVALYIANTLHAKYIDLDKISEKIRDNYKQEIAYMVSDFSIIEGEKINSKALGNILFNNEELMTKYNLFIYEKQIEILDKEKQDNELLVIDSIFLPIMSIFSEGDYKILVRCEEQKRLERIAKRDAISLEYIKKRVDKRITYHQEDFDYVIDNDNDYTVQVNECIKDIERKLLR